MNTLYPDTSAFVGRPKQHGQTILCPRCKTEGPKRYRRKICESCYSIEHSAACVANYKKTKLLSPEKLLRGREKDRRWSESRSNEMLKVSL